MTPGQTLYVEVGGNGGEGAHLNPGGFNGGGEGGSGGGGASDVRTTTRAAGLFPDDRLLVAGGGGGGGQNGEGGCLAGAGGAAGSAAGEAGKAGTCGNQGGGPGTQSGGGAGGANGCGHGEAGQLGAGGVGGGNGYHGESCHFDYGGGGGGGYYGGGGGCGSSGASSAGGGGGSSLVPAGGSEEPASYPAEHEIQITYTKPPGPEVITAPASLVVQTSATLNATVNPEGEEVTNCHFDYGTTPSYGSSMPCASPPGSGTSPVAESAGLTGLSPNTPYHFRISATNASGTRVGSEATFATLPNPPTVVTEPAASVAHSSATLEATVNPNGGMVSACRFEYGTSPSLGSSAPCTPSPGSGTSAVAVSAAVTGLTPNTTYDFKITATNAGGTSSGSEQMFTTPRSAPIVQTQAASGIAQSAATLNATVNPEGEEVTNCHFEYGTTPSYGSSLPCASLPGMGTSPVAVSVALAGLKPNTTYDFKIVATNATGTGEGANQTFATLPNPPTVATEPPSSIAQSSATLNATVNPEGSTVSVCRFEYGTTPSYGSSMPCASLPGSGTSPVAVSAALTGLSPNTTYYDKIVATNGGGTSFASQTFTTLANEPTVETHAASAVTQTSATLNATVNPEARNGDRLPLRIRHHPSVGSSVPCASLPGSGTSPVAVSAGLTGLTASTTYHVRISATNASGTERGTDVTFATTVPQPPTVVTDTGVTGRPHLCDVEATVNPNGGTVSACQFEYGTSPSSGRAYRARSPRGRARARWRCPLRSRASRPTPPTTSGSSATNAGDQSRLRTRVHDTVPAARRGANAGRSGIAQSVCDVERERSPQKVKKSRAVTSNMAPRRRMGRACRLRARRPGTGTSPVAVSAALAGPHTQHQLRLPDRRDQRDGYGQGADLTFTTPSIHRPSSPNRPLRRAEHSATFNATVDPERRHRQRLSLRIRHHPAVRVELTVRVVAGLGQQPGGSSATLTGLAAQQDIPLRIVATNPGGTSDGSDKHVHHGPRRPARTRQVPAAKRSDRASTRHVHCTTVSAGEDTGEFEWEPWPAAKDRFSSPNGPCPTRDGRRLVG